MKLTTFIKTLFWTFILILVIQLGWILFTWLLGTPFGLARYVWLGLILSLTLTLVVVTVIFHNKIWVIDPVLAKMRELRSRAKKQFNQTYSRALSINKSPGSVPWYLFLALQKENYSSLMAELGYVAFGDPVGHKGLVVSTWVSPTAVAYRVDIDANAELSFDLLDIVLQLLFKSRPDMAINAAFVEYELADLVQSAATENGNITAINRILNVAFDRFGMDVPIHVALVGLEHIPDISRAVLLTEQMGGDTLFGGFLTDDKTVLAERIDDLFDDILRRLDTDQLLALQKQIAPEFCASLLNAPFQLSLLQTQLKSRMVTLTQARPPRRKVLNLQSISFVGGRSGMATVDPLSQVSGKRFFGSAALLSSDNGPENSVTIENASLFAAAYHREGFMVQQNRRYSAQLKLYASISTLVLSSIVAVFAFLVLDNYRSYGAVNDRLKNAFNDYFLKVKNLTADSDFLVQRIQILQPLRETLDEYAHLHEKLYRRVLPNWSMEEMYKGLYDHELTTGLQASLISFMEKEIFAYQDLEDGVKLLNLASIESQIYSDQAKNKLELIGYFELGLGNEGADSNVFQSQLRLTLEDLFELNQPWKIHSRDLHKVLTNMLSALDPVELIYSSLMRRSSYLKRVDLRDLVGKEFSNVFVPMEETQSYFVKQAYTRTGFDMFFDEGGISGLEPLMENYGEVLGTLPDAMEDAIIRGVISRYTADYIASWTPFLSSLRLRDVDSLSDAQLLINALTNQSDNIIDRLTEAVKANTQFKEFIPNTALAVIDPPPKVEDFTEMVKASTKHAAECAKNIRKAFQSYLDVMTAEGDQKTQFDFFVSYARDVNNWLQNAASSPNGAGTFLFNEFQNMESINPLAGLNSIVIHSPPGVVHGFAQSIVNTIDDKAMELIYDYIEGKWRDQILSLHHRSLSSGFPFAEFSDGDLPLTDFTDLFAPEGKLMTFEKTHLSGFKSQTGVFVPRETFSSSGSADISENAKSAFSQFRRISEVLFVDGKPYLEFELRPVSMSPDWLTLYLKSGDPLFQFSHGPSIWGKQKWPVSGIKESDLTLQIKRYSGTSIDETFEGSWSWFRFIKDGIVSLKPKVVEAVFSAQNGNVTLQLKTTERFNPFGPAFFSGVRLPETLFDRTFSH